MTCVKNSLVPTFSKGLSSDVGDVLNKHFHSKYNVSGSSVIIRTSANCRLPACITIAGMEMTSV